MPNKALQLAAPGAYAPGTAAERRSVGRTNLRSSRRDVERDHGSAFAASGLGSGTRRQAGVEARYRPLPCSGLGTQPQTSAKAGSQVEANLQAPRWIGASGRHLGNAISQLCDGERSQRVVLSVQGRRAGSGGGRRIAEVQCDQPTVRPSPAPISIRRSPTSSARTIGRGQGVVASLVPGGRAIATSGDLVHR
jgi:hypothetical protein